MNYGFNYCVTLDARDSHCLRCISRIRILIMQGATIISPLQFSAHSAIVDRYRNCMITVQHIMYFARFLIRAFFAYAVLHVLRQALQYRKDN